MEKKKLTKKETRKLKKLYWKRERAKKRFQNRNVTKAKKLYWYLVLSGIFMFGYAISCIFTHFSLWFVLSPIVVLAAYSLLFLLWQNWKVIWLYVADMEQGRLLMFLNQNTHYSEEHKMKVIKWVYLRNNTIRKERKLSLHNKLMNGGRLTLKERKIINFKSVHCPQQLLDGVNKAILVNALIWAHVNVSALDEDLRKIMELTDKNMASFRLKAEIDRCKKTK